MNIKQEAKKALIEANIRCENAQEAFEDAQANLSHTERMLQSALVAQIEAGDYYMDTIAFDNLPAVNVRITSAYDEAREIVAGTIRLFPIEEGFPEDVSTAIGYVKARAFHANYIEQRYENFVAGLPSGACPMTDDDHATFAASQSLGRIAREMSALAGIPG